MNGKDTSKLSNQARVPSSASASISITTSDLYEAGYYLLEGYDLEKVDFVKMRQKAICQFTFSGEKINESQMDYQSGMAVVNLSEFRRTYCQLNSLIGSARKELMRDRKEVLSSGASSETSFGEKL